ncbi:hypothetical protein FBZ99_10446 [Rhizobium sp. ERR 1071]|nr:hypothetical protein FBZ99_10446 [Rhizobium sp. ERR1071]
MHNSHMFTYVSGGMMSIAMVCAAPTARRLYN